MNKIVPLIIFTSLFVVNLYVVAESIKSKMLESIIEHSRDRNYTRLNGFPIIYYRDYLGMASDNRSKFLDAFVLLEGKITSSHWSYYGGAKAVIDGVGCGFFNRYYENIKWHEAQDLNISAICVLPYFNKCVPIIEGIDNYYN